MPFALSPIVPIDDVTVVIRWILALALGVAAAWLAYGRVGSLARSRATLLGALRALAFELGRLCLEDVNKEATNNLAFLLWVTDAGQLA